jgi:RNA polymerase sigma-70 factor (ECF subfamily)
MEMDKALILEASKGDMESFEEVYRASSGFVYNVALRITRNPNDAEEVTQDVFIKVYKNLSSFGFNSSFKTWVYRITVNTALNLCKKRSRELKHSVEYNEDLLKSRPDNYCNQEKEKHLDEILGSLNPDQRACMTLRNIQGLSYREIAEVLKVNINTVRSRLKRAREAALKTYKSRGDKDEL